jgi:hypothetical protein
MWNETRWHGCWNADQEVGLFLHVGRFRADLDMWWAQSVAYLPGRRLLVDRSWGRVPDKDGVRIGNLDISLAENGWSARFDGVGELTDIAALSSAPRGASAPMTRAHWQVEATPSAPVWNLTEHVQGPVEFAGDLHIQQGHRTTGSLVVEGREYRLDGIGFSDHSTGVRDWEPWAGHRFMLAVLPSATIHVITVLAADGQIRGHHGVIFGADGTVTRTTAFQMSPFVSFVVPEHVELTITPEGGEPLVLRAELAHAFPTCITEDNTNINGIDWKIDGDPVVLLVGLATVTMPDGTVGHAYLERCARRSALTRPCSAAS